MKYKWKDKVRIKSKKELERISEVTEDMLKNGGAIMTIACLVEEDDAYIMKEDGDFHFLWTDEMIEGIVEEETQPKFKVGDRVITNKGYIGKFKGWVSDYQVRVLFEESGCNVVIHPKDLKLAEEETKPNVIEEAKVYWDSIKDAWICPEGYIFKDENGNVINSTKIVLEKKKKEYPKTYEECCKILGCKADDFFTDFSYDHRDIEISDYEDKIDDLLQNFRKLRYCRDAYWKIAGEEMGLGKPWEPNWKNHNIKYVLFNQEGEIDSMNTSGPRNYVLAFPTEEMRDAFYENFKSEIEICKELL